MVQNRYVVRSSVPGSKGMQDKQMEVLEFIKMISDMGTELHRWSSNNSMVAEEHPPDHGLCTGCYGYDEWSDIRNR